MVSVDPGDMDFSRSIPFRDLSRQQWQNLAVAALLAVFAFYFAWELALGRLCGQIGVDFCAYWSAARIASVHGYGAMYDLDLLGETQRTILPAATDPTTVAVLPFSYLPVFVLPFQVLARLSPGAGFLLWSLLNLVAFWTYFQSGGRRTAMTASPTTTMFTMLASLPVFLTLFTGQVSVVTAICVAEFMRCQAGGRPVLGGLWLGGLLLKPQALVLLLPLLILQRSFKTLAGLAISGVGFGLASLAMIGPGGLSTVLGLWRDSAEGRASNWVVGMLNFRMLEAQLSAIMPRAVVWPVIGAAMAATVILVFVVWRRPHTFQSPEFAIAMLGILAATISVAWHAHIHMAMLLIPPLILLYRTGIMPGRLMHLWVFLPSLLFLLSIFVPPALARLGLIRDPGADYIYLPFAAAQLFVDLCLFYWALRKSWSKRSIALEPR